MRLYNPEQCTLAATPRARKQHTPPSYLPSPGAKQRRLVWTTNAARPSLDSSCRHSHETDSTASTRTDHEEPVDPFLVHKNQLRSSKFRMICQSPIPRMLRGTDSFFTPSTKSHHQSPESFSDFHFDIDDGFGSPFVEPNIYSLDNPPPSFDIDSENPEPCREATRVMEAGSLQLKDEKDERSICSSSTISSNAAPYTIYHPKAEGVMSPLRTDETDVPAAFTEALPPEQQPITGRQTSPSGSWLAGSKAEGRDATSPMDCNSQSSSTPSCTPWETFPADKTISACDPVDPSMRPVEQGVGASDLPPGRSSKPTGHHCISQASSFESSFEHVKEGESISIMIHRKDPKTGACTMRSYFRDERGRWSKFQST